MLPAGIRPKTRNRDIYGTGTPYVKVYPHSTRLCYLFWSEFTGTSIEYRYNYLFTHNVVPLPALRFCWQYVRTKVVELFENAREFPIYFVLSFWFVLT